MHTSREQSYTAHKSWDKLIITKLGLKQAFSWGVVFKIALKGPIKYANISSRKHLIGTNTFNQENLKHCKLYCTKHHLSKEKCSLNATICGQVIK